MRHYHILALIIVLAFYSSAHAFNRDLSEFEKWRGVMDREKVKSGGNGQWLDIINKWDKIPYVEEPGDNWQTREETKINGGDCEDFAIAVYYDLIEGGADERRLLIVVAQIRDTKQIHAYLRYGNLVIDHRDHFQYLSKKEERKKYFPLYGLNRLGWVNLLPDQQGAL